MAGLHHLHEFRASPPSRAATNDRRVGGYLSLKLVIVSRRGQMAVIMTT